MDKGVARLMGHDFIYGTIEATEAKLNKVLREKQEQAAYMYGHDGYSGTINVLDGPHNSPNRYFEYTKYMFQSDLKIEDWTDHEIKTEAWGEERKNIRKMMKLKAKYNIKEELTVQDLVKLYTGKPLASWKKFILHHFWREESDNLYVIRMTAKKVFWFGSARC